MDRHSITKTIVKWAIILAFGFMVIHFAEAGAPAGLGWVVPGYNLVVGFGLYVLAVCFFVGAFRRKNRDRQGLLVAAGLAFALTAAHEVPIERDTTDRLDTLESLVGWQLLYHDCAEEAPLLPPNVCAAAEEEIRRQWNRTRESDRAGPGEG